MNTCNLRLAWAAFTLAIVLSAHGASGTNDSKQTAERIAALRSEIIPPPGTDKSQVDTVYGIPKEVEFAGMGSSADYPIHIYQLLPPRNNAEFRAFLYITYRDGKVLKAGIKHICVTGGRPGIFPGPLADEQQRERQKEIEQENLQVLADLEDIQAKFKEELKAAVWNKKKASN